MSVSSNHKIGRGKFMSVAKAALKVFYEEKDPVLDSTGRKFITYDDLETIHAIIDVAGCEHCSFLTSKQVINCLYHSPYWDKDLIYGFFKGIRGHGNACAFTPSEKGWKYYENFLKEIGDKNE